MKGPELELCVERIREESVLPEREKLPFRRLLAAVLALYIMLITVLSGWCVLYEIVQGSRYQKAVQLMEQGKYQQSRALLVRVGGYRDAAVLRKQLGYEAIAFHCIAALQRELDRPDTLIPYELDFYVPQSGTWPVCFLQYGSATSAGGWADEYAIFSYSPVKRTYFTVGHCASPSGWSAAAHTDRDRVLSMIRQYAGSPTIGGVNMQRVEMLLQSGRYRAVPLLP